MRFLANLWKNLTLGFSALSKALYSAAPSEPPVHTLAPLIAVQDNARDTPPQALQDAQSNTAARNRIILNRLQQLKRLLEAPKEAQPDARFKIIQEHLGIAESYETIRQERWYEGVSCPSCHSLQIKRIAQLSSQSADNHRYQCLACGLEFNDDSGTPLETGVPPLHIWMQCWYLMGCTDSFSYIAHQLHLDLAVVEVMINQLKEMFHAQKPLTQFSPDENLDEQIKTFQTRLKEDLLKKHESLDANIATPPKDTREFRRQQTLRRSLNTDPEALTPFPTTPGATKRTR